MKAPPSTIAPIWVPPKVLVLSICPGIHTFTAVFRIHPHTLSIEIACSGYCRERLFDIDQWCMTQSWSKSCWPHFMSVYRSQEEEPTMWWEPCSRPARSPVSGAVRPAWWSQAHSKTHVVLPKSNAAVHFKKVAELNWSILYHINDRKINSSSKQASVQMRRYLIVRKGSWERFFLVSLWKFYAEQAR